MTSTTRRHGVGPGSSLSGESAKRLKMSHPERRQETGKINAAIPVIDVLDSQPVPELICEDSQDEHDNKNEGTEASSSKPVTTCIRDSLEIKQGNVRLEEQYDTDSEASTLSPKDHTEAGVIAEDKNPCSAETESKFTQTGSELSDDLLLRRTRALESIAASLEQFLRLNRRGNGVS